jgi:hypothetical protein
VQFTYFYDVPLGDQSNGFFPIQEGGFYRSFTPRDQLATPIVPLLGPATAPLLNGKDAFTAETSLGTQPAVVSWSAPKLGKPTKYMVTVANTRNVLKSGELASVTAVLYDQTSFKVPGGLLNAKDDVYGVVTAMKSQDQLNDPLLGIGSPSVEVTTVFGYFHQ